MTLLDKARQGKTSPLLKKAARTEGVSPDFLNKGLVKGTIVILANLGRGQKPLAIGRGLPPKVNANIGTSPLSSDLAHELKKLKAAVLAGADTVMDLSTGGDLAKIRRQIVKASPIPVGTVPIYQSAVAAAQTGKDLADLSTAQLLENIEENAQDGVSFVTVHCGVTGKILEILEKKPRKVGVVSRGGCMLLRLMKRKKSENPLYERFDDLLKIAKKYDLVLSLGDGLRPGCLADASDKAQLQELKTLGELQQRAFQAGVQVMIEGPGHVPYDQIAINMELEKKYCHGAPFYVLGPLVTDIAVGYDHLNAAIGATAAALAGADFLCYVTPAEHVGLPSADDVYQGVIACRIAAHAAQLAKGDKNAWRRDNAMAAARAALDWEKQAKLALDPVYARKLFRKKHADRGRECTMCGQFCVFKIY